MADGVRDEEGEGVGVGERVGDSETEGVRVEVVVAEGRSSSHAVSVTEPINPSERRSTPW